MPQPLLCPRQLWFWKSKVASAGLRRASFMATRSLRCLHFFCAVLSMQVRQGAFAQIEGLFQITFSVFMVDREFLLDIFEKAF